MPYWAPVNKVNAVFGACLHLFLLHLASFFLRNLTLGFCHSRTRFFSPHCCSRTLYSFLTCSFCLCNKTSVRHGHMLLLMWPVLCIIPILKSKCMLNDSAPFFSACVGSLKHRLFVYVYPVHCKVRSAACRDNAHMYYRKRKGFISKMDRALFLAVVCANEKDGIVKYI